MGIGTVVLKMEVLYLKEAKLGDHLKIITRPEYLGNTSFVLKQDIYNQFDEHITDAKVTMVMFDTVLRKGIRVINQIAQYFR
jgi:acyl-CoA thioesterase FadM